MAMAATVTATATRITTVACAESIHEKSLLMNEVNADQWVIESEGRSAQ